MKNWREDAQPKWPEAALPTGDVPAVGAGSQSFSGGPGQSLTALAADGGRHGSVLDVPRESDVPAAAESSDGPSGDEPSSDLRDPWGEEPAGVTGEAANDPGEVTVQLDPLKQGRTDGPDGASDVPVFVDESGRRSRTFRRIGILVGTACGAYAVAIVATLLSGNAGAPWLPLPVPGMPDEAPAAGKVDSTPAPDSSKDPRYTGPGLPVPGGPGATASVTGAAPGLPGASAAPGVPAGAAPSSGAAAAARPSASGSVRPGAGPTASASAGPGPSSPVIAPTPSAPPPASSPAASPSPVSSPSPAGGASSTVADGPAEPAPAAAGPAA